MIVVSGKSTFSYDLLNLQSVELSHSDFSVYMKE